MGRLIDADVLKNIIESEKNGNDEMCRICIESTKEIIDEQPTVYDPDKVVWFHTEDRRIHPYETIRSMAAGKKPMDAVVCYNDQTAQQVIRALQEEGLRIPEDISVTGYDNSSLANREGLRLTTIDHPQEKLGAMAADLLLSMVKNDGKEEGESVLIQPVLVEGNSCK